MKLKALLRDKLNEINDGVIFGYADLNLAPEIVPAASVALSRMVAQNKLKKIGRGKFYKPIKSRLGELEPLLDEQLKDLLYRDGKITGYITGIPVFSQMGLTSQFSSDILIGSSQYRRPLIRGNYKISFCKQANKITRETIPLLRFLDAIKLIKKIPGCTADKAARSISKLIDGFSKSEIKSLIEFSYNYPPSTRALLGAILENKGIVAEEIKKSLNPLSKFSMGINTEFLPNQANWNIRK